MKLQGAMPQAVSVAEFKRAVHVDLNTLDDDPLFNSYLMAAQEVVEMATRRPLLPRQVEIQTRAGMGLRWWFPACPVLAVSVVEAWWDGAWAAITPALYRVEMPNDEPQIVFESGVFSNVDQGAPLRVTATVGGPVPRAMMQAIILMAKDWYEAGIAVEGAESAPLAFGVRALIRQQTYRRPVEWSAR